jgi:phosphoglycerate dehydrogenase-like enzyme
LFYPGAGVVHQDPADLPTGCVMTRVFEHGSPIAEYVMYMMLRHVGRFEEHAAAFREGYWSGSGRVAGAPHGELAGKTVSVLGFGTIGREVKRRAEAFGMTVRRKTSAVEDWGFWDQCDFLVTACPLTEATRGIVDREKLARLKDGAMLIHVSRGEVVEEEALYRELESGRLSAAMDVWYHYPEDLGESAHGSRWPFQQLPNVVATPHLSAWTHGLIERRMRKIAANMDRLAQGQKLFDVVLMGSWRM